MTSQATFDYQPRTRLIYGVNAIDRVGELAAELGGKRILLVTDGGIVKAGHAQRVLENLSKHADAVTLYDKVRENPTTKDVDMCLAVAREAKVDLIVGLGGGSSMDTAKGTKFYPHEWRTDEGLLGCGQGDEAHAAIDRHPHHSRHRQRMPVRSPDCR
jgi:alcohol dehydrogenase